MVQKLSLLSGERAKLARRTVHGQVCPPPGAYTDLDEIWEYIAGGNLDAADRVLAEIHESISLLVCFPHQGHTRPDLDVASFAASGWARLRDCLCAGRKSADGDCHPAWPPESSGARSHTQSTRVRLGSLNWVVGRLRLEKSRFDTQPSQGLQHSTIWLNVLRMTTT